MTSPHDAQPHTANSTTTKATTKVTTNAASAPATLDAKLLRRLSEAPGVSGREEQVRAVVIEALRPLVDEVTVDALGNVIATKRGTKRGTSDRRVMLAAHMDEIGFMVRYIEEAGFLRVQPLGGFDARVLIAQRVRVHTTSGEALRGVLTPGGKNYHILAEDKNSVPKVDEFYVDLGLPSERVTELVSIGDPVTMDRACEQVGSCVIGKAMDDRAGVFTMIEAMRRLGKHEATVIAVATVQEEVGLRGAGTAAYAVQPDVAIALDVTAAMDTPGFGSAEAVTKLGAGAAIKVFDASHIPNYKLVAHLRAVAERGNVPFQLEVLPRGGTDAAAMQRSRAGATAITVSLPTRYLHTPNEMVDLADLDAAATLLARYLEDAHAGEYAL